MTRNVRAAIRWSLPLRLRDFVELLHAPGAYIV